jgi:predicted O-linked N-acetylglucosamine transferase (SPINDLY family)
MIQQLLESALQHAQAGRPQEAERLYRQVLALEPRHAQAWHNLGVALAHQGRVQEAMASFQQTLALEPNFPEALFNLGNAYKDSERMDDAMAAYRQALAIRPSYGTARLNLAATLLDIGQLDQAIGILRRLVQDEGNFVMAHSGLLYALHFHPDSDAQSLLGEHRQWSDRHARPLRGQIRPHDNDPSPQRRLRIGYVSADFRFHPVGRFLAPLLAHHDHGPFEIFCYGDVQHADEMTGRLRSACDVWRDIRGGSDEQVAELIRQDRIDVLVDLSLHTGGNRLLVFARKPAPVQVTYLAYCSTSGLETMDYRLTDPHCDPPGLNDANYSETSIRLPCTYWCYEPWTPTPAVNDLPAKSTGQVTFGCLNNYGKVSLAAWRTWQALLAAAPNSRLVVHAPPGTHQDQTAGALSAAGIDPRRLSFVPYASTDDYFRHYHQIDIGLDPFPYGGGTTTCDAMWMGVPVVTLAGRTGVGRGGVSILSNVGVPELIANSVEQYVEIARSLAGDLARLAQLRATLRGRMRESALMDAAGFARDVEAAYRQMWRQWCRRER